MNRIVKSALFAIALSVGATTAHADTLLNSLAAKGQIVTVHGIADGQ